MPAWSTTGWTNDEIRSKIQRSEKRYDLETVADRIDLQEKSKEDWAGGHGAVSDRRTKLEE